MAELNVWTDGVHREVAGSMDEIRAYRVWHGVVTEVNIICYENNIVGLDIKRKIRYYY